MDQKRLVKASKYLARHLRHEPGRLGLELAPGGWVRVDELLQACSARSFALTMDELREVVEKNNKRRFSFDETETWIRASQGHSVEVDLGLDAVEPPAVLFHGTSERSLGSIMATGLNRMERHHVHLSEDLATAYAVGKRHGRPVVLRVSAREMAAAGHQFYVTDNRVWLTAEVPAIYLAVWPEPAPSRDVEHSPKPARPPS